MLDRTQSIRPWFAAGVICVGLAGLFGLREFQVATELRSLRQERQQLVEQQESTKARVQEVEAAAAEVKERLESQTLQSIPTGESPQAQKRIAALESRIQQLQSAAQTQRRPTGPVVP